jgi:NADH-quinone oxidoreductase subunit H
VTTPDRGSVLPDGSSGWPRSLLRGFLIFLLIAGIGLVAAVTTFALAVPGVSFGGALRIGALYLGPFHHVALVFEGDLAVDASRLPGANLPAGGSATIELGVALLAVTALAVWLLFRAGRLSAFGDRAGVRALTTVAVIPFGAPLPTRWGLIPMVVADLPVGFLFILAISSLGVYGIVLAGWASNNKYALLGGLRSSAQMISYEISMGMSTIPVLLLAGNVTLSTIVTQQAYGGWNFVNLTVAFFIFIVAAFAETNRVPFDLPEAETELVAGYHTEYSAMKFSLFPISEYCNMITASALMATLFFGGWDVPFTGRDNIGPYSGWLTLLSVLIFLLKTGFFLFLYIWVRWTIPRFRYDQLMSLGWKVMLPIALAYIIVIAAAVLVLESAGIRRGAMYASILGAINMSLSVILFAILDRGRVVSPAYEGIGGAELAHLRGVSQRSTLATGAAE